MFYISTQGHSASHWLTKSLNAHGKVVCWHGTRSIPPFASDQGRTNLTPEEFVIGLEECEKGTFGEKIFGSIHGYHGIAIKQLMEKKGGKFFAIFRNPLARIHSIFSSFFSVSLAKNKLDADVVRVDFLNFLKDNSNDIDDYFLKIEKRKRNKAKVKKFLNNIKFLSQAKTIKKYLSKAKKLKKSKIIKISPAEFDFNSFSKGDKIAAAVETFEHACVRTFISDLDIIKNCNFNQILKMEEYVISKDYFKKIFFDITGFEANSLMLDKVFSSSDHFIKHSHEKDLLQVYEAWPTSFKNAFNENLQNIDLQKTYDKLGYKFLD